MLHIQIFIKNIGHIVAFVVNIAGFIIFRYYVNWEVVMDTNSIFYVLTTIWMLTFID